MANLEDAIKEAYALSPVNTIIYHTLEFRQGDLIDPVYIVRGTKEIKTKIENQEDRIFKPLGFNFTLPPSTEEGFTALTLTVDNVDRRFSEFIQRALENPVPIEVIYRPYLSTDLSKPQIDPPIILYLKDVKITPFTISGKATFMDLMNKRFPGEIYTRERFPLLI